MFEPGRVCVKIAGREAGRLCVVLEVLDSNFAVVHGPGVRKRRCNLSHLEPTQTKIELKDGYLDELARMEEEKKK